jgi:hypothetical protein
MLKERVIVSGMKPRDSERFEARVETAVGMKAMVVTNVATEADLVRTRGEIVGIILDPRKLSGETFAVIQLEYLS